MSATGSVLARALVALLAAAAAPRGDGYDFLSKGKPAFARTAFQNDLKKNPNDARARTGLALAELALGNADGACEQLLEAIKRDPNDAAAHLGLARAFLLRARSRIATERGAEEETRYFLLDAENQGDRAAALDAKNPEPWIVITQARLELGKFEEAERAITEAQNRGLDTNRIRRLRAELSYFLVASRAEEGSEDAYAEAKGALEALIHDDPGSGELRLRLGDLHHAFGHWKDALECWQRGLAIAPFDRPALELLLAYLKAPELRTKARQVLETALEAAQSQAPAGDPRPGYALFCVGQAKLMDRELEEACKLFQKARALDPSLDVQCSLGLADAAYKSQRYDEAGAAWRSAFASNREEARVLLVHIGEAANVSASLQFLANQNVTKGKQADARELLESAYVLDPDNPGLCNNFAFLCRETGELKKSWEAYSHLIELAPEQPRYLNDAALILHDYLKKDLVLARSLYERAIAAADKLIADPRTTSVERNEAVSAKTDATSNLARLDRAAKR